MTLTRQLHITSGMKRGSGMSGKQMASWTMSRPVAPDYNIAMQQFTNMSCTTTNQHQDSPEESICEEESTIKDDTHHRRGHNIHAVVSFTAETDFSGKKEEFLSRDTTKQRVIPMISDELRERECHVVNEQIW